jgi:sterol desaturase/sphingolipid hydroxylase (fatty acid hydroxylase superfamily)
MEKITKNILEQIGFNSVLYFVFGIIAFWFIWKILAKKIGWRRIQPQAETKPHFFNHDLLYSAYSIILSSTLTAILLFLESQGVTQFYWNFSDFNLIWGYSQLVFFIFIYDAYFYWTHRWMHHPKVYRFIHKKHHKSTDPSPLTIFSFHPLETVIEFIPFLVLPLILPVYWPVFFLWQTIDLINNLFAHIGYEFYPKNWTSNPLLNIKTTSTHHNLHHEKFVGNYGLYFTYWDKLMNTEIGEYHDKFKDIYNRRYDHQS